MGGRGARSSIAKGGWKLPKNARLIGTEKQVKWAEEIRANYIKNISSYMDYLKKVEKTGSRNVYDDPRNFPRLGRVFVEQYHPEASLGNVEDDMKSSDLYKAFKASERGSQERKSLGKKFKTAAAHEAIHRLKKASEKQASEQDASWWIEHRMR